MKEKSTIRSTKAVRPNGLAAAASALGAVTAGACAIGACTVGACAIGALAVRKMAIGRLAVNEAAVRSLAIQDLTVARLHITETAERPVQEPKTNGLIDLPGSHSVEETVEKLVEMLQSRGVTLFAQIDHSGEAEKAGLQMPPTRLLIFGNPAAGTPIMLAAPQSAIDLPLKILVREDVQGRVWITYNSPTYLQARYGLPEELLHNLAVIETLASNAAG